MESFAIISRHQYKCGHCSAWSISPVWLDDSPSITIFRDIVWFHSLVFRRVSNCFLASCLIVAEKCQFSPFHWLHEFLWHAFYSRTCPFHGHSPQANSYGTSSLFETAQWSTKVQYLTMNKYACLWSPHALCRYSTWKTAHMRRNTGNRERTPDSPNQGLNGVQKNTSAFAILQNSTHTLHVFLDHLHVFAVISILPASLHQFTRIQQEGKSIRWFAQEV